MSFKETCSEILELNNASLKITVERQITFVKRNSKILYSDAVVQWIFLEAATTEDMATQIWDLPKDCIANQYNNDGCFLKFKKQNTIITVFTAMCWGGVVFEFPTHNFTLPENTTTNSKCFALFQCEKIQS